MGSSGVAGNGRVLGRGRNMDGLGQVQAFVGGKTRQAGTDLMEKTFFWREPNIEHFYLWITTKVEINS